MKYILTITLMLLAMPVRAEIADCKWVCSPDGKFCHQDGSNSWCRMGTDPTAHSVDLTNGVTVFENMRFCDVDGLCSDAPIKPLFFTEQPKHVKICTNSSEGEFLDAKCFGDDCSFPVIKPSPNKVTIDDYCKQNICVGPLNISTKMPVDIDKSKAFLMSFKELDYAEGFFYTCSKKNSFELCRKSYLLMHPEFEKN